MGARRLVRIGFAAVVGLVLAGAVQALDPAGEPPRSAPSGPTMHGEYRDGTSFDGQLTQPLRLKMDYGTQEIDPAHIHRIAFRPPGDERAADVIELHDKTVLRGRIEQATFAFRDGDTLITVHRESLRELKAVRTESAGLLAILFGLLTLTAMEIVLGIDNVIFLAIIAGKLPPEKQPRARKLGIAAALITRLMLLASLSFLLGLTKPIFTLPDLPLLHELEAREVSLRDCILFVGGLFLIGKSVLEMHEKLEAAERPVSSGPARVASFARVLVQIAAIDIIFSLDSVITAVGMVDELWVMVVAMVLAMLVMLVFAGTISEFVSRHPTLKVLALSFLILIGVMLTAEALGQHMNKGYIYFAMAFAVVVEMINLRIGRRPDPVRLHGSELPA